jgi:glycosyltransferase involved in cell wall biosynthesis
MNLASPTASTHPAPLERRRQQSRDRSSALPAVTVIIPSRGRPEFLTRAIHSVVNQLYAGRLECLVVFDGGECRLPSVELPAGRVLRAISNPRSSGAAPARNAGALAARGELLAFCDDDDEWLPTKLHHQVAALGAATNASAVCSGIEVVYGDRTVSRVLDRERIVFRDLLRSRLAELHTSTIVVSRRDFLGRIGPFDESTPGSYGEDYDWLLRAARAAPVISVPRALARIHWHGGSFFDGRWATMTAGLHYLLRKHPDFRSEPRGLARIYGQLAFAYAASAQRAEGRKWAAAALSLDWRQPRAYLALLVAARLLPPTHVLRLLHRFGRGI